MENLPALTFITHLKVKLAIVVSYVSIHS